MAFLNKTPFRTPVLLESKTDLYWKPSHLQANLVTGTLDITLGIWEVREAAQIDESGHVARLPLDSRSVRATAQEYPQLQKIIGAIQQGAGENAKKLLYELLAVHPDLAIFELESDEK